MSLELSILYRGDLASCNYDCHYCPFAKHWESSEELAADRQGLSLFVDWVASREADHLGILFTPWGEALVRSWYREAIVRLSHLPQVRRVAVQTNLSCSLGWLVEADLSRLALWCSFHPTQTTVEEFLEQCEMLDEIGVRYSVGCVGLSENLLAIEDLRRQLPEDVYLWINAQKDEPGHNDPILTAAFATLDPLFTINLENHASFGQSCRTGREAITVDAQGDIRRCHFVDKVIGNIYDPDFPRALRPRPCPNATCDCHIGYVHLERLDLYKRFGEGLLERIPTGYR